MWEHTSLAFLLLRDSQHFVLEIQLTKRVSLDVLKCIVMVRSTPLVSLLLLWGDHPSQGFASRWDHIARPWSEGRGQKWEGLTSLATAHPSWPWRQRTYAALGGWGGTCVGRLGVWGWSLEDRRLLWTLSKKVFHALPPWNLRSRVTDHLPWTIHTVQQNGAADPLQEGDMLHT